MESLGGALNRSRKPWTKSRRVAEELFYDLARLLGNNGTPCVWRRYTCEVLWGRSGRTQPGMPRVPAYAMPRPWSYNADLVTQCQPGSPCPDIRARLMVSGHWSLVTGLWSRLGTTESPGSPKCGISVAIGPAPTRR